MAALNGVDLRDADLRGTDLLLIDLRSICRQDARWGIRQACQAGSVSHCVEGARGDDAPVGMRQ